MNEQNQMAQMPQQPQMQQPVMQQQVMAQPQKATSIQDSLQKMDKDKVFKYVGIAAGVLIILSVFVPYISVKAYGVSSSTSIWEATKLLRFIFIVLGLVPIATFFFNKAKQLANVTAGAALIQALSIFDSWLRLESARDYTHLHLGFFMMLIAGLGIVVVNVIENIDEIKSVFVSTNKPAVAPVAPVAAVAPVASVQPAQPVAQPAVQPVQPAVQPTAPVTCAKCGAAKVGEEKFCMSCGNQF